MKIGSIVVRCYGFDEMFAFWQEALHYVPREPTEDSWVILRDPEGKGPNLDVEDVDRTCELALKGQGVVVGQVCHGGAALEPDLPVDPVDDNLRKNVR